MQFGPLNNKDFSAWTGAHLRTLREHFGWTQEQCARQVFDVSRSTLNAWENTSEPLPRVTRLAMIGAVASGRMDGAQHE